MRLFDHFDLLAPLMDRAPAPDPDRMRSLLDLPCRELLLDAGGGTGRVIHQLAQETAGVLVVDISQGMLKKVLTHYPNSTDRVHPLRASVNQLPFPDGSFSRILVVDAWHHFADQAGAADELVRVLAHGGRLIIGEPNGDTTGARIMSFIERLALMYSHVLPIQELADMLRTRGLEVTVQIQGMSATCICIKPA